MRFCTDCINCGTIKVRKTKVTVWHDYLSDGYKCRFICPKCENTIDEPISVYRAGLLIRDGAELRDGATIRDIPTSKQLAFKTPGTRSGWGATIRAGCPTCRDVQLYSSEVVVRICIDNKQRSYTFRCPNCNVIVVKEASKRIVDLLIGVGVRVENWHLPAELEEEKDGEPINHDDLLDFHQQMESGNWQEDLQRSERGDAS